jgi:arylformamidase
MTRRCITLVVCTVIAATACTSQAPRRSGATTGALIGCGQERTFVYAEHQGVDPNLTSLDVYTPAAGRDGCGDRPLVVWVHGGGWNSGDKREYMPDKVALFNGAGWVFASVNYRLTDTSLPQPSPQYPVHDQDTADAVAWLVAHARDLGVDARRVAVLGHSAGGGIVAAISTDDRYLAVHGLALDALRCAAGLDGEGYDVTWGATQTPQAVQDGYRRIFGSEPAVWAEASPINHVSAGKGIPDTLLFVRGDPWRTKPQMAFADALRKAEVPTTVVDAASLEHADLTTQVGAPGDTVVTPPLMDFLHGCFQTG